MTTPWTVPRDWVGETVAVLASGPSMSAEIADEVRGRCRVIAVNNQGIDTEVAGKMIPAIAQWADMLYAADMKWWAHYKAQALAFAGQKVTIRTILPFPEVLSLEQSTAVPFDPRPTHLVSGGNSGYQAVHIAAQRGAQRILLCGFDMKPAKDGRKHWFGEHDGNLNTGANFRTWIHNFERLRVALDDLGVRLVNCTPGSALRGIRTMRLAEALNV
jgi:hypothetical protein